MNEMFKYLYILDHWFAGHLIGHEYCGFYPDFI